MIGYVLIIGLAVMIPIRGLSWGFYIPLVCIALALNAWRKDGRRWWLVIVLIAWFGLGLWKMRI